MNELPESPVTVDIRFQEDTAAMICGVFGVENPHVRIIVGSLAVVMTKEQFSDLLKEMTAWSEAAP